MSFRRPTPPVPPTISTDDGSALLIPGRGTADSTRQGDVATWDNDAPGRITWSQPAGAGKVGWEGQQPLLVTSSGLSIVPGVGVFGRTDAPGGRLLLDTERSDPPESLSYFEPGVIATGTIARWHNSRPSALAYVSALEANFRTPPAGGSSTDFYQLLVTDSAGLTLALPISTPEQRYYGLDRGDGVEVATNHDATDNAGGQLVYSPGVGQAQQFTPTAAMTITGARALLAVSWRRPDGNDQIVAASVHCSILDADLNELASSYYTTTTSAAGTVCNFGFPQSLTLEAGAVYYLAIDAFEATPDVGQYWLVYRLSAGGPGAQPVSWTGALTAAYVYPSGVPNQSTPQCGDFTWAQFFDPSFVYGDPRPDGQPTQRFEPGSGQALYQKVSLVGRPSGGAPLTGDLVFAIGTVGAPATDAAGADLNVRAMVLP